MDGQVRQAVVLAGGLGTRLGELTEETPKPLLPVGGRPFLEWVLDNLARRDVEEVVLAIGYRAEVFDAWLADYRAPLLIRTYLEEEPLGTGGALPVIAGDLDDTFAVLNGDTLLDAPVQALGALRHRTGAAAAVALRRVPDIGRYGGVSLDGDRVLTFDEKGGTGPGLVNGGIYVLTTDAVARLGSPSSIERDLLPALAVERALVGLPTDGFFIDIGVPDTYASAQAEVPAWWKNTGGPS